MDPPASGLFTEVSFRRLLASCTDIVSGDNKGRQDLVNWKTSVVFHHYVETLQEQLADLKSSGRIDEEVLQTYTQQVASLSGQLHRPELPAYCTLRQQGPAQQQVKLTQSRVPPPAAVPTPKLPSGAPSRPAPFVPIKLSDQAKTRLEEQGRVHEALTDELAGMAESLKDNTLAIQDKLKERGDLLDKTEGALDKSLEGTKASAASATKLRARGRLNFCLTCMILLAIGVGFAGMYVFIRFTSLTGYKASKAVPMPVPVPVPPVLDNTEYDAFSSQHEEL